ncbi:TfdA family Taurine catabolism dioxygenase TauD [Drepanopeziza brunnea f. sp. 'multigermtubi' MB_m1]|uniref:TfdA family Taurine catabolism dioxygenase TauD n=1 Tax=Marssonina brunnea f. sp. multigermtubi (strain MB_m1) TaxID=1072389 RepID=K1Y961_MARBU|nr:TfdA family Taurine catabolism dioxygenase TauD [Drepanopeziza brunnea f. sp. 'multigermtubi' MB_m1]EKD21664.1 TfdA family Taurine catabolism dioxygenase TauD [Drepanopeziza brunnea f. sp. 'multigermtubi' MB_m1]
MAPSATETITLEHSPVKLISNVGPYKELAPIGYEKDIEEQGKDRMGSQPPRLVSKATYKNYLPRWDINETYPTLELFEHRDHGLDAELTYPDLWQTGVTTNHLTPTIGTEVSGIQLTERKFVAFRDQDFADLPIDEALDYVCYFGKLHIHPTSGAPAGYPEVHLVHRGAGDKTHEQFFQTRTGSVAWHSDVPYEKQPLGTTFLYILDVPESGGDTLFSNQVEAYNRLSDGFKERLHGLKATHSGVEQVNASRGNNGAARREPVVSEHPIVRTNPVTGEKALYVNPQFTRSIVGYKQEESDVLVTSHSALVDWKTGQRRHLARIAPQAEPLKETPFKA